MNTQQKLLLALLVSFAAACASNPPAESDDAADDDGDDQTTESSTKGDAGSGGSKDTGGKPNESGDGADCSEDTPEEGEDMLTTFEDGTVGLDSTGGWVGGFYIFNDKDNDPSQTATVEKMSRCSDGSSEYAYCTKGAGFMVWGAGIGTDLGAVDEASGTKETVDLSAYKGVSFWAKRNGTSPSTVKVIIPDENTSDESKKCTNASDAPATMKCDPFVTNIQLSSDWTKHTVMFDKLKQGGWGKPVMAFSKDKVFGVQLQFPMGMPFDVCVDQFVLVR